MRQDFNKLLTERERLGHSETFHRVRHIRKFETSDEFQAGRESMKGRYGHAKVSQKSFNENLNPLKNFLRCNVGRPWDKIYSDICTNFDKRKVINAHILEHLFSYVELNVFIIDGKPHSRYHYGRRHGGNEFRLITSNPRYPSYYVDPRDGIMKAPKRDKSKVQKRRDDAASLKERQDAVWRKLDDLNHLFFVGGVWYHYEAKPVPEKIAEYRMPADFLPESTGYARMSAWSALGTKERSEIGDKVMVAPFTRDEITEPEIPGFGNWRGYKGVLPENHYFYKRSTASRKQLKAFGLDGAVLTEDVKRLSHREAAKYRSKKKAVG